MAALAHNVLKFVRKPSHGVGPPVPGLPAMTAPAGTRNILADVVQDASDHHGVFRPSWLAKDLRTIFR